MFHSKDSGAHKFQNFRTTNHGSVPTSLYLLTMLPT